MNKLDILICATLIFGQILANCADGGIDIIAEHRQTFRDVAKAKNVIKFLPFYDAIPDIKRMGHVIDRLANNGLCFYQTFEAKCFQSFLEDSWSGSLLEKTLLDCQPIKNITLNDLLLNPGQKAKEVVEECLKGKGTCTPLLEQYANYATSNPIKCPITILKECNNTFQRTCPDTFKFVRESLNHLKNVNAIGDALKNFGQEVKQGFESLGKKETWEAVGQTLSNPNTWNPKCWVGLC